MLSDLIMQVNSKWYWHESKSGNQHLFLWKKERVFKKFKYNMKRWSFHRCCAFYNSRRGLNWNRDDSRFRLSKICKVQSTDLKKDVAAHLFVKEKGFLIHRNLKRGAWCAWGTLSQFTSCKGQCTELDWSILQGVNFVGRMIRIGKNQSDLESVPPLEGQDRKMARYCPPVLIAVKMQHDF